MNVWAVALGAFALLFGRAKSAGATGPAPAPGGSVNAEVRSRVLEFRSIVEQEISGRHVTPALVLAVIARETGGISRPGDAGEIGLMQVGKSAWQDYITETNDQDALSFPTDLESPRINIRVGSWFLNRKIEEMGDRYHGLRAYNCGARGARENPTCGAGYASWVVDVGEPSFRKTV